MKNYNLTSSINKNFVTHVFTYLLINLFTLILTMQPSCAFEDIVISTNGKMTDIKIQNNDIIDVFPLITIMNDKNTIIVHPLKVGKTKFSIVKDNKEKFIFNVNVGEESTRIDSVNGFDILSIDCPPKEEPDEYFDLDAPPVLIDIDTPPTFSRKEEKK